MTLKDGLYYTQKLIANSWLHKAICASFVAFFGMIGPEQTLIFYILFWLWIFSMIFGTVNGSIQNGFNLRKFLMGGVKIITYGVLIYFAKSLDVITHVVIWVDVFTTFMIYELLLSIIKHCSDLGIPMPSKIIKFIQRQEEIFEERFLEGKKKL